MTNLNFMKKKIGWRDISFLMTLAICFFGINVSNASSMVSYYQTSYAPSVIQPATNVFGATLKIKSVKIVGPEGAIIQPEPGQYYAGTDIKTTLTVANNTADDRNVYILLRLKGCGDGDEACAAINDARYRDYGPDLAPYVQGEYGVWMGDIFGSLERNIRTTKDFVLKAGESFDYSVGLQAHYGLTFNAEYSLCDAITNEVITNPNQPESHGYVNKALYDITITQPKSIESCDGVKYTPFVFTKPQAQKFTRANEDANSGVLEYQFYAEINKSINKEELNELLTTNGVIDYKLLLDPEIGAMITSCKQITNNPDFITYTIGNLEEDIEIKGNDKIITSINNNVAKYTNSFSLDPNVSNPGVKNNGIVRCQVGSGAPWPADACDEITYGGSVSFYIMRNKHYNEDTLITVINASNVVSKSKLADDDKTYYTVLNVTGDVSPKVENLQKNQVLVAAPQSKASQYTISDIASIHNPVNAALIASVDYETGTYTFKLTSDGIYTNAAAPVIKSIGGGVNSAVLTATSQNLNVGEWKYTVTGVVTPITGWTIADFSTLNTYNVTFNTTATVANDHYKVTSPSASPISVKHGLTTKVKVQVAPGYDISVKCGTVVLKAIASGTNIWEYTTQAITADQAIVVTATVTTYKVYFPAIAPLREAGHYTLFAKNTDTTQLGDSISVPSTDGSCLFVLGSVYDPTAPYGKYDVQTAVVEYSTTGQNGTYTVLKGDYSTNATDKTFSDDYMTYKVPKTGSIKSNIYVRVSTGLDYLKYNITIDMKEVNAIERGYFTLPAGFTAEMNTNVIPPTPTGNYVSKQPFGVFYEGAITTPLDADGCAVMRTFSVRHNGNNPEVAGSPGANSNVALSYGISLKNTITDQTYVIRESSLNYWSVAAPVNTDAVKAEAVANTRFFNVTNPTSVTTVKYGDSYSVAITMMNTLENKFADITLPKYEFNVLCNTTSVAVTNGTPGATNEVKYVYTFGKIHGPASKKATDAIVFNFKQIEIGYNVDYPKVLDIAKYGENVYGANNGTDDFVIVKPLQVTPVKEGENFTFTVELAPKYFRAKANQTNLVVRIDGQNIEIGENDETPSDPYVYTYTYKGPVGAGMTANITITFDNIPVTEANKYDVVLASASVATVAGIKSITPLTDDVKIGTALLDAPVSFAIELIPGYNRSDITVTYTTTDIFGNVTAPKTKTGKVTAINTVTFEVQPDAVVPPVREKIVKTITITSINDVTANPWTITFAPSNGEVRNEAGNLVGTISHFDKDFVYNGETYQANITVEPAYSEWFAYAVVNYPFLVQINNGCKISAPTMNVVDGKDVYTYAVSNVTSDGVLKVDVNYAELNKCLITVQPTNPYPAGISAVTPYVKPFKVDYGTNYDFTLVYLPCFNPDAVVTVNGIVLEPTSVIPPTTTKAGSATYSVIGIAGDQLIVISDATRISYDVTITPNAYVSIKGKGTFPVPGEPNKVYDGDAYTFTVELNKALTNANSVVTVLVNGKTADDYKGTNSNEYIIPSVKADVVITVSNVTNTIAAPAIAVSMTGKSVTGGTSTLTTATETLSFNIVKPETFVDKQVKLRMMVDGTNSALLNEFMVNGVSIGATGAYVIPSTFPANTNPYTFDVVINRGGVYNYTIELVDAATNAVIATSNGTVTAISVEIETPTNGTIVSIPADLTTLVAGQTATFTFTPAPNYYVTDIMDNEASVFAAATGVKDPTTGLTTYTWTSAAINADHIISAVFSLKDFRFFAEAGLNGAITPAGEAFVQFNAEQTYTITPSVGFDLNELIIDGAAVKIAGTDKDVNLTDGAFTNGCYTYIYKFANVDKAHTITANFATATYLVATNDNAVGYVISPEQSVSYNGTASFVIELEKIAGVTAYTWTKPVNDAVVSTGANGKNTLVNPNADASYTIKQIREPKVITVNGVTLNQYAVTCPSGTGYTVTPVTVSPVNHAEAFTFTVALDAAYSTSDTIVKYQVGTLAPVEIHGKAGVYTIANDIITAATTITVEGVALSTYAVTFTPKANVTFIGDATVIDGAEYNFKLVLAEGYTQSTVIAKVNGVEVPCKETEGTLEGTHEYTIALGTINGDLVITAEGVTDVLNTYAVTFTPKANVIFPENTTVSYDAEYTFEVKMAEGYTQSTIVVTAVSTGLNYEVTTVAGSNGTYNCTIAAGIIRAATAITVGGTTDVKNSYAVAFTPKDNVTFNGLATVNHDAKYDFDITIAAPYTKSVITVTYGNSIAIAKVKGTETEGQPLTYTCSIPAGAIKGDVVITVNGITTNTNMYTVAFGNIPGAIIAPLYGSTNPTAYGTNFDFVVELTPAYSNSTVKVMVDGAILIPVGNQYQIKNIMSDKKVEITGVVENVYTVTLPATGTGYTTTAITTGDIKHGAKYDFTVNLDASYSNSNIIVTANNSTIYPVNGVYTVYNITANQNIAITNLTKNSYSVMLEPGNGYTITPLAGTTVLYGENYKFSVVVTPGYDYSKMEVKANGTKLTATGNTYTITAVKAEQVVTVTGITVIVPKTYTVALPNVIGVKLVPITSSPVTEGGSFQFTAELDAAYSKSVMVVKANAQVIPAVGMVYTINDIKANQTVTVEGLVKNTYTVTLPTSDNYTIATTDNKTVNYGEAFTFTVTLKEAYTNANIIVTANNMAIAAGANNTYTINGITANQVIAVANVVKNVYTIALPTGAGYTATGLATAEYGSNYTFTVTVATGYDAKSMVVKANGTPLTAAAGVYTINAVKANQAITVEGVTVIVPKTYTVTLPTVTGVEIVAISTLPVTEGGQFQFMATTETAYSNSKLVVKANGVPVVGAAGFYTINNITANQVVTIEAPVKNSYTITVTQTTGGVIAPATAKVEYGASTTFTITPNAEYNLESVMVDGVNLGKVTEYTFTDVVANHSISATFSPKVGVNDVVNIESKIYSYGKTIKVETEEFVADATIQVVDLSGRIIENVSHESATTQINVQTQGAYIVRLMAGDVMVKTQKVIIK